MLMRYRDRFSPGHILATRFTAPALATFPPHPLAPGKDHIRVVRLGDADWYVQEGDWLVLPEQGTPYVLADRDFTHHYVPARAQEVSHA